MGSWKMDALGAEEQAINYKKKFESPSIWSKIQRGKQAGTE